VKVENARRLTGRGFYLPGPGAAVELWWEPSDDRARLELAWQTDVLTPLLAAMGAATAIRYVHLRETGLTCGLLAPIDRLLAVADALEWGALWLAGASETTFSEAFAAFKSALVEQANPPLLALEAAAKARGVPFLWDEVAVSLGLGVHAEVFPLRGLPAVNDVAWARYRAVPVGLVTGTNGKTTTTRMTAQILGAAGHTAGLSSTDAIAIGGVVVEAGDWTGPGATRRVLRDPRVTAAVLETARGGILRRGLAYELADAAIVTNIGADHFGEYGINSLEEMARVKAVVWDGVRPGGKRIANAGCPVSLQHLAAVRRDAIGGHDWVLFGRQPGPELARHAAAGGETWTIDGDAVVHRLAGRTTRVIGVDAIPATFGGTAVHNVENALAAAALAFALGVDHAAVARGLAAFGRSPRDNPGRLEVYEVAGRRVILDFAHNPHGVHALAPVIASLRKAQESRLMVVTGQAGDRIDHDMVELARAILDMDPDRVAVRPIRGYERGRALGEVEAIMQAALIDMGLGAERFAIVDDEIDALDKGIAWAEPGDIVLVLAHIQRVEVQAWLAARTIT